MLRFRSLGSGSSGNATVIEAGSGHNVRRLLVDCGLGLRHLEQRLARAGIEGSDIHAIFITHEHGDHIGCARAFAVRQRVPVWMSVGTYRAIGSPDFEGLLRPATDGIAIDLGEMCIAPFTVPHDAREPLQLTCTDGASRLGIVTDLGHATSHVMNQLALCNALLLECNHESGLLAESSYPPSLKKRVGGKYGHLSNSNSAQIARLLNHGGLATVVAAHLSRENNRPELARAALSQALDRDTEDIAVADHLVGTPWIRV